MPWDEVYAEQEEAVRRAAGGSPLVRKIEDAIHDASRLGDNAFDCVEGRGLKLAREEIAAEVARIEMRHEEAKRAGWVLVAIYTIVVALLSFVVGVAAEGGFAK